MERIVAFEPKPNPCVKALIEDITQGRAKFFLLHSSGPTSYLLQSQSQQQQDNIETSNRGNNQTEVEEQNTAPGAKFRVQIGLRNKCSCKGSKTKTCVHILFVLIKVLRVEVDDPLVWQVSKELILV